MPTITPTIFMDFGYAILDENGNTIADEAARDITDMQFNDMTADVLSTVGITWKRGVQGNELTDRVGDVGTMTLALNNSNSNSAGLAGYYSPDHQNNRAGFGLDRLVELWVTDGVTTQKDWRGRLASIDPVPGIYGPRLTSVTAEDWLGYAAETPIRGITVQTAKRDDQLLTSLLALSPVQPAATSFATGDDTYTYALHDENSDRDYLLTAMQKITESGFGKLFLRGSTTSAETLTYIARSGVLLTTTPVATFSDNMREMSVTRNKRRRVKTVIVKTYPVQVDASNVVLWVSQREIPITAGADVSFDVHFRDPNGKAVRVAATSLLAAVAGTDFNFSSVSGSGSDLNSNLTVNYNLQADIATVTLTNTSGSTGYLLSGYQIRGKATYLYEPHSSVVDTGQTTGETLTLDLIYQDDIYVGDDIAGLVATWFASDTTYIDSITFTANRDATLAAAALALQPGDLIQITETQTGVTAGTYFVQGYEKTLRGKVMTCTLIVIPAIQISGVFVLDVSALDVGVLGA